jgi:hypothetical protein
VNGGGKKKPADPCEKCKTTPKLVKITVIRNATQANVTGAKNWATVKKASDDVIVEAATTPNTEDAWRQITWSGDTGDPVPGKSNQRTLKRDVARKHQIKASLGGVSDDLTVWVIWADLEVKIGTSETIDGGNDASGLAAGHNWPAMLGGGNKLGEMSSEGTGLTYAYTVGKMQAKATLKPDGIEDVVRNQFKMRRKVTMKSYDDGSQSASRTDADDTSPARWTDIDPKSGSSTREIYDVDAPGCSATLSGTTVNHTAECYDNFTQYVTVTLDTELVCSEEKLWSYEARVNVDKASDKVELNKLRLAHVAIPAGAHYSPWVAPAPSKGCFIATAAFGSPLAEEVDFLRHLRDQVLRKTRWGNRFFDRYWEHYYQISPMITAAMEADPQLRHIVRWSIVTPLVNYLRLVVCRPRDWNLDNLDPEWKAYLTQMKAGMDAFIGYADVPEDFRGCDREGVIDELIIAIDIVLKEPAAVAAYLDRLTANGCLPLSGTEEELTRWNTRLKAIGRSEREIRQILGTFKREGG